MTPFVRYPRTRHLEGSSQQPGDEDLTATPFSAIAGRYLVIEEKMDGANSGIGFSSQGQLLLQSRGHYLVGGPRERHFALLKTWASRYAWELWKLLGDRYVLFGEWLYAKHTIFYTDLPHYFLEFDLYDREQDAFLSTARRAVLVTEAPFITSVQVLHAGPVDSLEALVALVGPSSFISGDHRARLRAECRELDLDADRVLRETDPSGRMEGLYIKVEEEGLVRERYKWVRPDFLQTVLNSGEHWLDRPMIPNQLAPGVDLFG